MRTNTFDAWLDGSPPGGGKGVVRLASPSSSDLLIPATVSTYPRAPGQKDFPAHVRVLMNQPVEVRWMDRFQISWPKKTDPISNGLVLVPLSRRTERKLTRARSEFLMNLRGDSREALRAFVQDQGMAGMSLDMIMEIMPLSEQDIWRISHELESEGSIFLLAFSPLFLQSRSSLEFLCRKILDHLSRSHLKHPNEFGIPEEKIRKKFGVHHRFLALALGILARDRKIEKTSEFVALAGFVPALSEDDKKILKSLEEISFRGQLQGISMEDLRRTFHLSTAKLNRLLTVLTEKKKVIQGKDGFILGAKWLDELVDEIRRSGKSELSVADFKAMTGLTRKYAIPLLELLDEMGVTRRRGAVREIIR